MPRDISEYSSLDALIDGEASGDSHDLSSKPPVEQSLDTPNLPPSKLHLKVGVPIILLRNLRPHQGLCNRTRLQIISLTRNCIEARILGGTFDGQIRLIPRVKLSSQPGDLPYIITRTQFPVRVCFAMTIYKSQGQSFDI